MTNPFLDLDTNDLLEITKALVNTPSISQQENELCTYLNEWILQFRPDARITRVSNTLVVHVGDHSQDEPVIFAGHIDTVVPSEFEGAPNTVARVVGDKLFGLGTADMKSGIAVMIALLAEIKIPATFVFYEAEEISDKYNGLRLLVEQHVDLIQGKWAILMEPTDGGLEMGCQGAITVEARFDGLQAHSARPWMGENAIHKAVDTLAAAVEASASQPRLEVEGLVYPSTLQITKIHGGVAGNIIPGDCVVTINHRYLPTVTGDKAEEYLRELCTGADEVIISSNSEGAMPAFDHPLVDYAREQKTEIVAKVAWTDVARFYALGIPAVNCGPGHPEQCHRAGEFLDPSKLYETHDLLRGFLGM